MSHFYFNYIRLTISIANGLCLVWLCSSQPLRTRLSHTYALPRDLSLEPLPSSFFANYNLPYYISFLGIKNRNLSVHTPFLMLFSFLNLSTDSFQCKGLTQCQQRSFPQLRITLNSHLSWVSRSETCAFTSARGSGPTEMSSFSPKSPSFRR